MRAETSALRRGLATFQRNLAALQPVLRRALRTREIDLLEVSLHESRDSSADEGGFVEARWRMGGDLALPWQPRIELTGAPWAGHGCTRC